jgi:DNA-directed RNA polymerase specialized sigma24 family protein
MTPARLRKLTQAIQDATEARDEAIAAAATEGMDRAEICEATGLSDGHVRRIERARGVPPRPAGRPRKAP